MIHEIWHRVFFFGNPDPPIPEFGRHTIQRRIANFWTPSKKMEIHLYSKISSKLGEWIYLGFAGYKYLLIHHLPSLRVFQ
jgi:hypothetical protein